jgi:hypothetical protein
MIQPDPVLSRLKSLLNPLSAAGEETERGVPKCACGKRSNQARGFRSPSLGCWTKLSLYCGDPGCLVDTDRLTRVVRMRTSSGRIWAQTLLPLPQFRKPGDEED